jgi:MFS family permease
MLASALFSFFAVNLSSGDFLEWGWRYPFYVAFAINVVALFARLRLVVTDEFARLLESRELQPSRMGEMLSAQGRFVLIGAFVPLASFALFHLVTVFPLSWITLFTERSAGEFLMVQFAGAVVGAGAIFASGLIADRFGRRRHLALCAVLVAVFSVIAPFLLGRGAIGETIFEMMGFGLLGLTFGQAAGAVTSNFSSRYRYSGAALSSDLAWLIGAGFAPLVALGLSSRFGLGWVGVYLFSGAVCTLLALYFNRLEVSRS